MKFEKPRCICGSRRSWFVSWSDSRKEVARLLGHDGFYLALRQCSRCGQGFTSPYPDEELLDVYYRGLYRTEDDRIDPETLFRNELHYGLAIRDWLGDSVRGKVLDVGCGSGGVVQVMQECAVSCVGYDVDESYIKVGRQRGLDLRMGKLEDINGEHYDVIILRHVLEHLHDPMKALMCLRALLSESGVLYVEVPNTPVSKGIPLHHCILDHKWHFTPETFQAILQAAGLQVEKIESGDVIRALTRRGFEFVPIAAKSRIEILLEFGKCLWYQFKTKVKSIKNG